MRASLLVVSAVVALVACSPDVSAPLSDEASLARGGPTDPTATWMIPLDDGGLAFRSDHNPQYAVGGNSVYQNGQCGVEAKIFATTQYSNSGDATIQTKAPKGKTCGRLFTLVYPDASTETLASFNNLRDLQSTTSVIPVGATVLRVLAINPGVLANNPSRCGRLLFGVNGGDMVQVTRVDLRTWHVVSQPDQNLAYCESTTALLAMPVDFTIVASRDLPAN